MARVETALKGQLPTECGKPLHTTRTAQGYGNLGELETDKAVCIVTSTLPESSYTMMPLQEGKTVCGYGPGLTMNQGHNIYININTLNMLSQNPVQI